MVYNDQVNLSEMKNHAGGDYKNLEVIIWKTHLEDDHIQSVLELTEKLDINHSMSAREQQNNKTVI